MLVRQRALSLQRSRTDAGLDKIWSVMNSCIERGPKITGELPGGLHVQTPRRETVVVRQ